MLALNTTGSFNVIDINTVEGYEMYQNKVKIFFYLKTEKSFVSDSIWDKDNISATGVASLSGNKPSLSLTFEVAEKEKTGIKMGVSFVDASQAKKFIKKATLNGHEWNKPWFSWEDVKNGRELILEMASGPNYKWGADPYNAPPSVLN
jgi:putative alpha-1,2-mannosidase